MLSMAQAAQFINPEKIVSWLLTGGVRILFIIIGAFAVYYVLRFFGKKAIRLTVEKTYHIRDGIAIEKRNETLAGIVMTTLRIVVIVFALLLILVEFGIDITPLLAGAGIVGLAIGFGAQNLVKDVLSGLFILLEDQYRKDDVVKIVDTVGVVEDVNLRRTILRDLDGTQHHIPNGEITTASNMTKNWSRVNLDISVSYDTDLDHAITVINEAGKGMLEDENFSDMIIKPPQVLGVDDFGDSGITLKVLGDTKPLVQWDIMRELRKRIKRAFDKEGIEIPFPQRDVHVKNSKL